MARRTAPRSSWRPATGTTVPTAAATATAIGAEQRLLKFPALAFPRAQAPARGREYLQRALGDPAVPVPEILRGEVDHAKQRHRALPDVLRAPQRQAQQPIRYHRDLALEFDVGGERREYLRRRVRVADDFDDFHGLRRGDR